MSSAIAMRVMHARSSTIAMPLANTQRRATFWAPAAEIRRPSLRRSAIATAAAADVPTTPAAPTNKQPAAMGIMMATRKALQGFGWDEQWIEIIVGEVRNDKLHCSIEQIETIVNYLTTEVGIPMRAVENMVVVAPRLLEAPLEQVQAVTAYVQQQGIRGATLVRVLECHPRLLTFSVAADGKALQKGAARASIDLVERQGLPVAGVSYWREGTTFQTAPLAPLKPSVL